MAFMALVSIFLFIVSNTGPPKQRTGAPTEVMAFRVVVKSVEPFSHRLTVGEAGPYANNDVEYTLWSVAADNPAATPLSDYLEHIITYPSDNQHVVFGWTAKPPPRYVILTVSHFGPLSLVGKHVEITLEIQSGFKSCSVDWPSQLGHSPGIVVRFDDCQRRQYGELSVFGALLQPEVSGRG